MPRSSVPAQAPRQLHPVPLRSRCLDCPAGVSSYTPVLVVTGPLPDKMAVRKCAELDDEHPDGNYAG
jgi:hypothetical protein